MTGQQLRQLRHYEGLTMQQFAEKIGTSRTTICAIETNEREMSDSVRSKIARAFPKIDDAFFAFSEKMHSLSHYN